MYLIIRLTLLVSLLFDYAKAQQPVFKNYNINDGLPSQVVYCAIQDADGFMWFGTDAGACRFDGHNFQVFTIQDGLSDNEILNIHKDSKGRLWFFTLNGQLSYFYKEKFYKLRTDSINTDKSVKFEAISFLEDKAGNIWIGSRNSQLLCIDDDGNSKIYYLNNVYKDPINGPNNWVFTYSPANNIIWIIIGFHKSRIFELKGTEIKLLINQSVIVPLSNQFYLQNVPNFAFYNGSAGICRISDYVSSTVIPSSLILHYQKDCRFFVDRNSDVWLTNSLNEVYQYKDIDGTYKLHKTYSFHAKIGSIFIDSEYNIWITTVKSGVFQLPAKNKDLKVFPVNVAASDQSIECVKLGKNDKVWFSTSNGNLYQLENDSLKMFSLSKTGIESAISNLLVDTNEDVLCITTEGLFLLHSDLANSYKFISIPAINGNTYYDFRAAKSIGVDRNNIIYLTSSSGLLQFKKTGKSHVEYVPFNSLMTHRIYCLYFDKYNNIWFDDLETLCCYNGAQVKTYPLHAKEFLSQITGIECISDSILVIGTYGNGIKFFNRGNVINTLSSLQGLADNLCRRIFIEKDTIYVATSKGFTYFSYHNNTISNVNTFTIDEGLPSNDIRYIAAKAGMIYLATSSGLCVMKKNLPDFEKKSSPPKTYLKSILINDRKQFNDNVTASYNDDISIYFNAITFDQPAKIIYQYKLNNNQAEWIETKNSSIVLSNIKPGIYNFTLRAKKYNSEWSSPVMVQLTIKPPYWQSGWFRTTMILASIIVGFFLVKYITGRNYRARLREAKAQQSLAEERNRIASDMHDDLGADLSNILLLTRKQNDHSHIDISIIHQFAEIERITNRVTSKLDEIIWALNPKKDVLINLQQYMVDYYLQVANRLNLRCNIKTPVITPKLTVAATFRRNLFLVLKEGLNNIIKHSGATEIDLDISYSAEFMYVTLRDNGYGFILSEKRSKGNGLINMEKRIMELGGKLDFNSLLDNGTTIKIAVPIKTK